MQENRIVGRHRKKRCRTTDSNHKLPVAPNLLQQNFECGITVERFNDFKLGDVIEAFITEKVAATKL